MSSLFPRVVPPAFLKTEDRHVDPDVVLIHEQPMSTRLNRYVELLSKKHPFNKDMVVDKRDVFHELNSFWPVLPKWEEEAQKIWTYISNAARSVSDAGTNERILVQIRVNFGPLSSNVHVESDEAMAMIAFDRVQGDMKSCLVPPMVEAPDLEAEQPLSGILVLCQPFPKLIEKVHDVHLYGALAGALYASRTLDNPLYTNTFRGITGEWSRGEQARWMQLNVSRYKSLVAATLALAALARTNKAVFEETQREEARRVIDQNEEIRILNIQKHDERTVSLLSAARVPVTSVAQVTDANQPVSSGAHQITDPLPSDGVILKAERVELPVAVQIIMPRTSPNAASANTDVINETSMQEFKSVFAARVGEAPLSVERAGPASVSVDEGVTLLPPASVPTASSDARVETVAAFPASAPRDNVPPVSDAANSSGQNVLGHPAFIDAPAAGGESLFTAYSAPQSGAADAASGFRAADVVEPLVSGAPSDPVQSEPHRPISSPVAAADAGGGANAANAGVPLGKASPATEPAGAFSSAQFAAMDNGKTDGGAEPLAAAASAQPAPAPQGDTVAAGVAAASTRATPVSGKEADVSAGTMKPEPTHVGPGIIGASRAEENIKQTSESLSGKTAPFVAGETPSSSAHLNSTVPSGGQPASSEAPPDFVIPMASAGKRDVPFSPARNGVPPTGPRPSSFHKRGASVAPIKSRGAPVNRISLLAIVQPKGGAPPLIDAEPNPVRAAPVVLAKKRRDKANKKVSKKTVGNKPDTKIKLLKESPVLSLTAKDSPPVLEP